MAILTAATAGLDCSVMIEELAHPGLVLASVAGLTGGLVTALDEDAGAGTAWLAELGVLVEAMPA